MTTNLLTFVGVAKLFNDFADLISARAIERSIDNVVTKFSEGHNFVV